MILSKNALRSRRSPKQRTGIEGGGGGEEGGGEEGGGEGGGGEEGGDYYIIYSPYL